MTAGPITWTHAGHDYRCVIDGGAVFTDDDDARPFDPDTENPAWRVYIDGVDWGRFPRVRLDETPERVRDFVLAALAEPSPDARAFLDAPKRTTSP